MMKHLDGWMKMKTLIINGSPKKNGDIAALLAAFRTHLSGEVKEVSCHDPISPCLDCRCCWKKSGCAVQDGMQEIYAYLEECDNIVLASPVWFSSLSGPMLNIASRFQTIYAGKYICKDRKPEKARNGVLILAGGDPGTERAAAQSAKIILKLLGVDLPCAEIYSMNTDRLPAGKDRRALTEARNAANTLNARCGKDVSGRL